MKLPIVQPQTETPNSNDFVSMQTQWSQILSPLIKSNLAGDDIPVGAIWFWPTSTAPDKFIRCSGQLLLQKLYRDLFLTIGTTYNTGGEPAGSFRLPADPGLAFAVIIKYQP